MDDPQPIDVLARLRALGFEPEETEMEDIQDHETGLRQEAFVAAQPVNVRRRLSFLRFLARERPDDVR
jgi:hypothetical protein